MSRAAEFGGAAYWAVVQPSTRARGIQARTSVFIAIHPAQPPFAGGVVFGWMGDMLTTTVTAIAPSATGMILPVEAGVYCAWLLERYFAHPNN